MNKIMYVLVGIVFVAASFGVTGVALAADLGGDNADYWYAESEPVYDTYNADYWYAEPDYSSNADYWYAEPSYNADYWYAEPSYNADYWYAEPNYDYGCGSNCYSSYTPSYSTGCNGCGGGYNSYSTPSCYTCGGGTSYSPPRYSPPVTVSQPAHTSIVNNNTNVNNVSATAIAIATPQYPIVYTAPTPAPYCTINQAQGSGYGYYNSYNQGTVAYLSWTSQNATSAFLSGVGSVGVSGSQNVYPTYTTTYTLTVYGQNGQTANCQTTVNVNTYTPPVYVPPVQPYVALTQIPYTGFDFGPIGNTIYWLSLLSFAVAGAYLMIYYRGGAFAFATNMVGTKQRKPLAPVVAPKAPILVEREVAEAVKIAPVVAAIRKAGTIDSMAIVQSKDGSMPKIIIERN